tara:strand:+ start:10071 stop:11111 length:1041 start_codon:yes stop_codon:yes gene_type:complete
VYRGSKTVSELAKDIDENGKLLIQLNSGNVEKVSSGELRQLNFDATISPVWCDIILQYINRLPAMHKSITLAILSGLLLWASIVTGGINVPNSLQLNDRLSIKTTTDFDGEKLIYDISFLWFKNAAEGITIFQQEKEGCVARLTAETKGFIGFITGYIKHFYVSHMKMVGQELGLRPYLFEKNIIYQKREEKTITSLDYENRIRSWSTTKKGKITEEKSEPIPLAIVYYDILSTLYNFRTSYYGEIQKGKDFLINVIPEKDESIIHIHVGTREEELKFKKEENIEDSEGYFLIVKIPKEIFKTKEGEVLIWGNKNLMPLNVIVRDYIGFGDVRATLREVLKVDPKS